MAFKQKGFPMHATKSALKAYEKMDKYSGKGDAVKFGSIQGKSVSSGPKMKSPLEQEVPISPVTNKPYPPWVMNKPEGEGRTRAMEAHDENQKVLADEDLQSNAEHVIKNVHPDYFVQDESALEMKSPIKQVTVEGTPTTIKQSLGFLEGDSEGSEKSEERKKYMTNKEYYKLYPELKPDPKDTMFRDVDEDGNVITRGLKGIGKGFGNLGRALGNIRLKGGGRGGYDMGPGGRGGWRG